MSDSNSTFILSDLNQFNPKNLVFHAPKTVNYSKNKVVVTKSAIGYRDDDGTEHPLLFVAPAQSTFGPSYQYPMGYDRKTSGDDPSQAKGIQVMYPLTSRDTVAAPTDEEKAFRDFMEALHDGALAFSREQAAAEEPVIPTVSVNSFAAAENRVAKCKTEAQKKAAWEMALKRPYAPYKKDGVVDPSMPSSMYLKMVTSGEGTKLRCKTLIYPPGDGPAQNPLDLIGQFGVIQPVIQAEAIFYGAHGSSGVGASIQLRVVQAVFTPGVGGAEVPTVRLIAKNSVLPAFSAPPGGNVDDGDIDWETPSKALATKATAAVAKTAAKAAIAAKSKSIDAKAPASGGKAAPSTKVTSSKVAKAKAARAPPQDEDADDPQPTKVVATKAKVKVAPTKVKVAPTKVKGPPPPVEDEDDDVIEDEDDVVEDDDE